MLLKVNLDHVKMILFLGKGDFKEVRVMKTIGNKDTKPNGGVERPLMLIDGEWAGSAGGMLIPVETPARRGTVIAEVPRAMEADVDRAVKAAAKAFGSWKRMAPRDRGKAMLKIAADIEAQSEDIAKTLSLETGNALRTQSRGEIALAADLFRFYGGVASEQKGETVPLGEQVLCYTRREPIGVVAGIIPWNSPVLLGALKITMALTASEIRWFLNPLPMHLWLF